MVRPTDDRVGGRARPLRDRRRSAVVEAEELLKQAVVTAGEGARLGADRVGGRQASFVQEPPHVGLRGGAARRTHPRRCLTARPPMRRLGSSTCEPKCLCSPRPRAPRTHDEQEYECRLEHTHGAPPRIAGSAGGAPVRTSGLAAAVHPGWGEHAFERSFDRHSGALRNWSRPVGVHARAHGASLFRTSAAFPDDRAGPAVFPNTRKKPPPLLSHQLPTRCARRALPSGR